MAKKKVSEEDEILSMMEQDLDTPDDQLPTDAEEALADIEHFDIATADPQMNEIPEEDEEEPPKEEPKEEKATPEPKKTENPSRAQERIRELARQKRETEAKLAQKEVETQELQRAYAAREATRLKDDIDRLQKQMTLAMQEQDAEAFTAAQTALMEAKISKTQLDRFIEASPKKQDAQGEEQINAGHLRNSADIPVAAKEWLENKRDYLEIERYKTLPLETRKKLLPIRRKTFELTNELKREGFSLDDPVFYEELDLRLGAEFPIYEDLALLGVDALNSEVEEKSSGETLKPQSKDKLRKVPVTSSSTSAPPSKQNVKVSVTPLQKEFYQKYMADRMTWAQYLEQVKNDSQMER